MPRPFQTKENFIESAVPEHLKLRVSHLHDGNSTPHDRRGHKYATIAKLFRKEDGDLIAEGVAYCSDRDVPTRKVGRMVAIGRALKEYYCPNPTPF